MAKPTDIRKSNVIIYNGVPHAVLSMLHSTQGRGAGFVQTTLRNLKNGSSTTVKFRTTENVEFCHTTQKTLEFSYVDGDVYHFIHPETFEDYSLPENILSDDKKWLVEGHEYAILFVNDEPVSLELPANIVIEVKEAREGLRGDTSSAPTKPVTLVNGVVVQVPLFIKTGDKLRIRTEDNAYISRA
ncbi:MAG: elongation factor P [Opitutales bacterium]|nr:elongation factor P [Opitutales bacterium]